MASLVAHAGALGDFITSLPAIDAWRLLHPDQPLVLLGKPAYAALAASPGFDEVWDIERSRFAPLFGGVNAISEGLHPLLRDISSAFLFAGAASPLVATLQRAGVKEIVRQDPFPSSRIPIVDYHLSLFPSKIVSSMSRVPRIACPSMAASALRFVAVHPGSGSRQKNWPLDQFMALARALEKRGQAIAWVLGPSEQELTLPAAALVWRDSNLPTLAARLARCRCYIGNDSGVTHLAAAVGCPTIALFGVSDAEVWAPQGIQVRILKADTGNIASIAVEDVLQAFGSLSMGGWT
jgi:ADP-heptose:LPS heptosyltransferase